jgi:hypothetical protein
MSASEHVPDFSVAGFDAVASVAAQDQLTAAHASAVDLKALKLSVCVGASYDPKTNQICFTIPIYGKFCITSPVHIPVGGAIKVCAQTCGSFIPTGVKATVYLNNNPIVSKTIVGHC